MPETGGEHAVSLLRPLAASNARLIRRHGLGGWAPEHRQEVAQNGLALTALLVRSLEVLDKAGIPALTFKGPSLGALLYGDVGRRTSRDVDLLVRHDDLRAAVDVLQQELGLKRIAAPGNLAEEGRLGHHVSLVGPAGLVEVHWRFFAERVRRVPLPFDPFEVARPVRLVGDMEVPALVGAPLLWYLLLHGTKHSWERLGWVVDVADLVGLLSPEERAEVWAWARRHGRERMVAVAFRLANEGVGAPVPEGTPDLDATGERLVAHAMQLWQQEPGAAEAMVHARFWYLCLDRRIDRLRYLWDLVWQPTPDDEAEGRRGPVASRLARWGRLMQLRRQRRWSL